MMDTLIDIHTHHDVMPGRAVFEIKNIMLGHGPLPVTAGNISVGWHPWYIENYAVDEIREKLEKETGRNQVIAIGECGLDRVISTPIDFQKEIFILHITRAEKLHKPVIVHCVKAYSDLLQLLKNEKFKVPLILHGFGGNPVQIDQFIKYNVFFSYGGKLCHLDPKIEESIKNVPLDRLFLETDESSISIEKIYLRAANILGISKKNLAARICENFKTVFEKWIG